MVPSPWQRGQVVTFTKEPSNDCWTRRISPGASTLRALGGVGSRLGACPIAMLTGLVPGHLDLLLDAEHGFLEDDLHIIAQISPTPGPMLRSLSSCHPEAGKDVLRRYRRGRQNQRNR